MRIFKKILYSIFISMLFFMRTPAINAAFTIENRNASYDSNTGILTLYDNQFSEKEYSAQLTKFKLGNITISGSYQFKSGVLKIYIRNKEDINQQLFFTENGVIHNGLSMEYGAIVKTYTPPNSINVVLTSPSNEKKLSLDIIGLKPKMIIKSFTTNKETMPGQGGTVTLQVNGTNLDNAIFKIHAVNSTMVYNVKQSNEIANTQITLPANYMETVRTDTFILYVNGHETTYRVSIQVLPMEEELEPLPNEGNIPSIDENPDKKPSSNIDGNPDKKPTQNEEITDKVEDLPNQDNLDDNQNSNHEEKESNQENNKKETNKNIIAIYIGIIIIVILSSLFVIIRVKKAR